MPGHLDEPPLPGMPATMPTRPKWSAARAARECGVGRATIQRALASGRIQSAERDDSGAWLIPVDALIEAGFIPGKPTPPDAGDASNTDLPAPLTHQGDQAGTEQMLTLTREVERLRGALDVEHARTAAAERLAAERGGRVEDLRVALRMLEAGNSGHGPVDVTPTSTKTTVQPAAASEVVPQSVGRLRTWLRGR